MRSSWGALPSAWQRRSSSGLTSLYASGAVSQWSSASASNARLSGRRGLRRAGSHAGGEPSSSRVAAGGTLFAPGSSTLRSLPPPGSFAHTCGAYRFKARVLGAGCHANCAEMNRNLHCSSRTVPVHALHARQRACASATSTAILLVSAWALLTLGTDTGRTASLACSVSERTSFPVAVSHVPT